MRVGLIIACCLALAGCVTEPVEEPHFALRLSDGSFEIREYAPTTVAETTVTGDAWDTRFEGFGPLADYIFAKDRRGETIAMTAPVTQASQEKIAMTAPVTQTGSEGGSWTIGFTMPAAYSMESLPKPGNPEVRLVEQPSRTMAVLRFTGVATDADMEAAAASLKQKILDKGLTMRGEPVFAFYDPPWTLSFMRRNEVMIEVVPQD